MALVLLVGLLPYTALPQAQAAGNERTSTQAGQRKIDQGTSATTFDPDGICTRAQNDSMQS